MPGHGAHDGNPTGLVGVDSLASECRQLWTPLMNHEVCLTEFSHGGGCGGKIASADLEVLLQSKIRAETVIGGLLAEERLLKTE